LPIGLSSSRWAKQKCSKEEGAVLEYNKPKKEFVQRIAAILVILLLMTVYFSGVFETLFTGYGMTFNPIEVIRCMLIYGFPTGPFIILILVMAVLAVYIVFSNYAEIKDLDVLGRNFKMSPNRQVYGDVHFESPEEFREIALVQPCEEAFGTILGQMDDTGTKVVNHRMSNTRDNKHIMVVGSSGSGIWFDSNTSVPGPQG